MPVQQEVNAQGFALRLLIFIGLDGITISELMNKYIYIEDKGKLCGPIMSIKYIFAINTFLKCSIPI